MLSLLVLSNHGFQIESREWDSGKQSNHWKESKPAVGDERDNPGREVSSSSGFRGRGSGRGRGRGRGRGGGHNSGPPPTASPAAQSAGDDANVKDDSPVTGPPLAEAKDE